ncbi:unnamed protein product [Ixodes persulcatus]
MRRLSVCNSPSGSVILLNESSASSFLPPTSSSIRLAGCEAAEQMLSRFVSRFPKDGRSMMLYGASASSFLYLAKQVARKEPAMEVHYVRMRHFVGRSAGQDSKQMLSNLFAKGQSKVKMVFLYLLDSLYAGSMSIEQLEFAGKVKEGLPAHLKRVLSTSNDWLIVVASARKPWLLPEEVQSNFQKWVYVGLPGFQERIDLLKACIGKMLSSLTDQNYLQLSRMTEEYTYSEIGNVVEEAHLGPFKRIESATHFVKKNERWHPCVSTDPGAVELSWHTMKPAEVSEPIIYEDLLEGFVKVERKRTDKCMRNLQRIRDTRSQGSHLASASR